MKKYNYIDLARTITMFLVVINHILFFYSDNPFWYIYADEKNIKIKCNFYCSIHGSRGDGVQPTGIGKKSEH